MIFKACFGLLLLLHTTIFGQKLDPEKPMVGVFGTSTLNENKINIIIDSIESGYYPNRHSLLIFKDNILVVEKYFTGHDQKWGEDLGVVQHSDTTLHDMRSVSKSIVSACIGIAIAQGKIKSVDQKIFNFFKDYKQYCNEGRQKLTIKHLLTMTSGLQWNEDLSYDNPENSEIQMDQSPDPIAFVLSRKLVSKPGTVWNYNGGTTAILAEIIQRTTGKNVYAFAKEYLFTPLGVTKSYWTSLPGTDIPAAASGLRLTSRDALKFGLLYLQKGMWENEQIIPPEYVAMSLNQQVARKKNGGYGFQFWIIADNINDTPYTWPTAVGNGDQRIFIDSKKNMVIVMTAGNYNQWTIQNDSQAILRKIYEAFE